MARNKHPEETVNQILNVAYRLFMEKGYEHTSIQDILNNLGGLSKGAIYHHFKSKEEILETVTNRMTEESNKILAKIRDRKDLTGKENIFLNGAILGYSEGFLKAKYDEIVEFSELGQFIEVPIRNYSSGMLARLAFSIATVVQPEILIVDEILAVGDAQFQEKSKRRMMELMGGGTTVLFVSHSIEQIREMCKRVVWLDGGELRMVGKAGDVCDGYVGG